MKAQEIWYPLKCRGRYVPFQYACADYLDKSRIRHSLIACWLECVFMNLKLMVFGEARKCA